MKILLKVQLMPVVISKALKKKYLICQELHKIESNHYNQGKLGRYQTDLSCQCILKATKCYLKGEE